MYIGVYIIGHLLQNRLSKLMLKRGYELTTNQINIGSMITGLILVYISYLKFDIISCITYSSTIIILMNITMIDLKHMYIPIELNIIILIIGLINICFNYQNTLIYLQAFLISGGIFLFLAIISRGGLGGGDIKLIAFLGLILGLKPILFTIYGSYVVGAIVGIILLILRKKKLVSTVPFAPFITIATIIYITVGEDIIKYISNALWTSM